MQVQDWVLLGLAIGAAVLSFRDRRAMCWLLVAGVNYAGTTIWWRSGGPSPLVLSAAADAGTARAIYTWGRAKWETLLRWTFAAMLLVNVYAFAQASGHWPAGWQSLPRNGHQVTLELLNVLALVWIGFTGLTQMIGALDVGGAVRGFAGHFRRVAVAIHQPRRETPFWTVR